MRGTQGHDRRGRFSKGDGTLKNQVFVRMTDAQHVAYLAAGGAAWLRSQLHAEIVRQRLAPLPTAANPFPGSLGEDAEVIAIREDGARVYR